MNNNLIKHFSFALLCGLFLVEFARKKRKSKVEQGSVGAYIWASMQSVDVLYVFLYVWVM